MSNINSSSEGNSKAVMWVIGVLLIIIVAAAALYMVDVDQTSEARLPTLDVDVNSGQMPEFDVDVAEINIGSREVSVDVPNVDVQTKTIEVEVPSDVNLESDTMSFEMPTISIDKPEEDNPADN